MDKNSLISHYAETPDERSTLSHVIDLAERSWSRSTVESGSFMSDALRMRCEKMLIQAGYKDFFFFGGYPDAERTCPVFYTDYCTPEMIEDTPSLAEITFVTADLDRFNRDADLSHRDVLGSLMERGRAVFTVKTAIAPFINESLVKVSRYPVSITLHEKYEIQRQEDFEERFDTVASLRLDAVTASLFSTSRSIASDAITAGLVSVNGATAKKSDAPITEGDKISFRGHGRAELEKIDGTSKKGRVRILFKKWK